MKVAITTDTHAGYTSTQSLLTMLGNIKIENPDVLIHCGDVQSNNFYQQCSFWDIVRGYLPDCKIISVLGNHDWWDNGYGNEEGDEEKSTTCQEVLDRVNLIYKEFNIHHASENLIIDNVAFSGFDGWYSDKDHYHATNDKSCIPHYYISEKRWLENRNMKQFQDCKSFLEKFDGTKVVVTHFGITPECKEDWKSQGSTCYFGNHQEFFNQLNFVDYIFYGHSHQFVDVEYGKTKVVNAGSDYDFPRYEIRDIV